MNVPHSLYPPVHGNWPIRCDACPAADGDWCLGLDHPEYCAHAAAERAGTAPCGYRDVIRRRSRGRRRDPDAAGPPYKDHDAFVSPIRGGPGSAWSARPWEGCAARKPWQYPCVAAIVHLDQPDLLEAVIATLRAQTLRPFLHVVDSGSTAPVRARLRAIERSCDDVQVDYLRPRGWMTTSCPVAVGMDLAFAACHPGVPHLYATHVDVFLKRPDFLEFLAARCDERTPVVGYQMSPRERWRDDLWRRIPSHTASLYHMPTMRRIKASWSMTAAAERLGVDVDAFKATAFPDTETNLGLDLIAAGIGMRWLEPDGSDPGRPWPGQSPSWLCLGPEPNDPYETPWLVHQRSYTAHATYHPAEAERRKETLAAAVADSAARVASWAPRSREREDPATVAARRASKPRLDLDRTIELAGPGRR